MAVTVHILRFSLFQRLRLVAGGFHSIRFNFRFQVGRRELGFGLPAWICPVMWKHLLKVWKATGVPMTLTCSVR